MRLSCSRTLLPGAPAFCRLIAGFGYGNAQKAADRQWQQQSPVRPDRMARLFRLGTPWRGISKSGSVSGTISFPRCGPSCTTHNGTANLAAKKTLVRNNHLVLS
jgi:hypothetical protein